MNDYSFPCDQCGKCCRNLSLSELYADLDDGTGVCRYLDKDTNFCKIYVNRPIKCNIVDSYKYFEKDMNFDVYIMKNIVCCEKLKEE